MAMGLAMLIMLPVFLSIEYHMQCDGLGETSQFSDNFPKSSSTSGFSCFQQDIYSQRSYCQSITGYTIDMMAYGILVPVVLFAQV